MKKMIALIDHIKQKPLNLSIESNIHRDGTMFSYLSYHNDRIYGRYFEATLNIKNKWIILYHGLGAHTNTEGYLTFVSWWNAQGYDVIGMDVRHQGGLTKGFPEPNPKGLYLSGIENFENYYYTAIYIDAYRLVDVAYQIKQQAIIANGGSQGGTLSLFVGATHPKINLILADMPSNIDIKTLINHSTGGYKAFLDFKIIPPNWLFEEIDLMSYVKEIKKPVLMASGSDDTVCPISTAEHFFESLDCKKSFMRYDHYGHGGYDIQHFLEKIKFIKTH
jgi:cephalosporin-C deacetylase